MNDIKLSVVIPVYNEEITIARVLEEHIHEIRKIEGALQDWEILCLDDASTDGSFTVMDQLARIHPKIRLLRNFKNKGIAASFDRLFKEAGGTHIYLTAGDDQWPAVDLGILFQRMKETSSDLVIGIRQNRHKVYTAWRRFLSFLFNAIPRLLFKVDTQDANGIKLGRREIFVMELRSRSFFAEIERIILAHERGYKITSAPILFKERTKGKAKGASWFNMLTTLRDLIVFIFKPRGPESDGNSKKLK